MVGLEQITQEPSTFKKHLVIPFKQFLEDSKDSIVGFANWFRGVELTPEYINGLHAKIEGDTKYFEAIAAKQYGNSSEASIRVTERIKTKYNNILKKLRAQVEPFVQGKGDIGLPQETKKKLGALIMTYELVNAEPRPVPVSNANNVCQVDEPREQPFVYEDLRKAPMSINKSMIDYGNMPRHYNMDIGQLRELLKSQGRPE